MTTDVVRLQKEIDRLLAQAEGADESDDSQFGDLSGDEIPDELARRKSRLKTIEVAKAALEERARETAAAHVAKMEAEGRNHRTNAEEAVLNPKDPRNFTAPESKIMKTTNKPGAPVGDVLTNAVTLRRWPTKHRLSCLRTSPIRPTMSPGSANGCSADG